MSIILKTQEEIQIMREGGKILAEILETLKKHTKAGIKTKELNSLAEELMRKFGVEASFKNYRGYPASICISVNDEVVHGIPGEREIKKSDIISIDCGVFYKGLHTDSAITILIPPVKPDIKKFVKAVQQALENGIAMAIPGNHVGDISNTIQKTVEKEGYSPVRNFIGHGVGKFVHEDPQIPNFGKKGKGPVLKPGMTLAIEPIINMGERYTKVLPDKWTAVTKDGSLCAQIEHTIVVTNKKPEILTRK